MGWIGFVFLPVPLAVAGEWFFEYRKSRFLRPIDALGEYIHNSRYRLAIVAMILLIAAVICCVCMFYIDVYLR